MNNKKVLILTYYWPPFGGTGVYRILKFTKYLAKLGWEPIIVTPKKANARIIDENLLKEIPSNAKVYYSGIWEPSIGKKKNKINTTSGVYFQNKPKTLKGRIIRWIRLNIFVPDAKIGWYPFAVSTCKKVIKKEKPAIIFSTSPPPTTSIIAKRVSRWSGLPWIADFRDPWTKIYYLENVKRSSFANWLNKKFEREVHKEASAITVVNDGFFPHLSEFESKTTKIINGFDRDDVSDIPPQKRNEKFTIRYFGGYKQNQESDGLLETIKLISKDEDLSQNIKFDFYGYTEDSIKQKFKAYSNVISFHSYIARSEALKIMKASDAVLLLIGKGKNNKIIVSTKIFEYLMLEKPVIGSGPKNGAAGQILEITNSGKMFDFDNIDERYNYIKDLYSKWKSNEPLTVINKDEVNNYDFKKLTEKLASIFETKITDGTI